MADRGAEFHILLGELSGNPLLENYLSEVVWRCALILAVHGHDHDQTRSINEHEELIALLSDRDGTGAAALVDRHVSAVEDRALSTHEPATKLDLLEVLSRY